MSGMFDCDCNCAQKPNLSGTQSQISTDRQAARDDAQAQLDWQKQVYSENQPRINQLYDMATKAAQQQMGLAQASQNRSDQQWGAYRTTFAPVESQTVMDAMGQQYLSDADRSRLASIVSGTSGLSGDALTTEYNRLVNAAGQGAADQAQQQAETESANASADQFRESMRYGLNPAQAQALNASLSQNRAAGTATVVNQARQGAYSIGAGLRTGTANFGRGLTGTSAQMSGLSGQMSSAATGNAQVSANASLPYNQFMAQGYSAPLTASQIGLQGTLGYGGLMNQQYNVNQGGYNAMTGSSASQSKNTMGFIGDVVGAVAPYVVAMAA